MKHKIPNRRQSRYIKQRRILNRSKTKKIRAALKQETSQAYDNVIKELDAEYLWDFEREDYI